MNTEAQDSGNRLVVIESMKIGDLPTPERMAKGGMVLTGTGRGETLSAMEEQPLLIDRLYGEDKTLSEGAQLTRSKRLRAGVRITRLHDIAMRKNGYGKLTLESLMQMEHGLWEDFSDHSEAINAVDLYHKTMSYMTLDARRVVSLICFEQRQPYALHDVCFDMLADCLKRAVKFIEETA